MAHYCPGALTGRSGAKSDRCVAWCRLARTDTAGIHNANGNVMVHGPASDIQRYPVVINTDGNALCRRRAGMQATRNRLPLHRVIHTSSWSPSIDAFLKSPRATDVVGDG